MENLDVEEIKTQIENHNIEVINDVVEMIEIDHKNIKKQKKLDYAKSYYQQNKEKIKQHEKFFCNICDSEISWVNKSKHTNSKIHRKLLENITEIHKLNSKIDEMEKLNDELLIKLDTHTNNDFFKLFSNSEQLLFSVNLVKH